MSPRRVSLLATLVACGCTVVAPKSRLEPHERVVIELRAAEAFTPDLLGGAPDARALEQRFAAAVTTELARRRSIAPNRDRADAMLAVQLLTVALEPAPQDRLALRISAGARIESAGQDPGKARTRWHASEYESPARARADWSGASREALDAALATGMQAIARDLVRSAIRARETP